MNIIRDPHRITFALLFLAVAGPVLADSTDSQTVSSRFSGWSVAATMDVNDDGIRGFSSQVQGNGSLGRFSASTVSETGPVTGLCGPTAVELPFTVWSTIQRLTTGELIYFALDEEKPSVICFDFVSQEIVSNVVHARIIGGTGRFRNATGQVTFESTGDQILSDVSGDGVHSSISGRMHGRVYRH